MANRLKFCGVILSAGASSRMGRDKAMLPWPPTSTCQTLLTASISSLKPFVDCIIVVAGSNAEILSPIAAKHGALLVQNPAPERGQFSSLQTGLKALVANGYDAAMITLVDSLPLSSASLRKLVSAYDQAISQGMWSVAPEHGGKRGHPLLASRALIDAFLAAPVTSNAHTVKREHAQLLETVPVPDAMLTVDVNTPEQYAALASGESPQH